MKSIREKSEEHAPYTSEDLEEAAVEAFKQIVDSDKNNFLEIFKAGANWQKQQFEKDYTDLCKGIATIKGLAVKMTYDKGMADAREQMMKDAIDGEIGYWNIRGLSVNMDLPSTVKEGDKVKVIVIKND